MEDTISKELSKLQKADILFETVEEITGIGKQTILSKNRESRIAIARNIMGYILHKEIGYTSTGTGKILNIDHSTVVYYAKMFDENYHYYTEYRDNYILITELFWSKFMQTEKEEIDLQVKSLQSLMEKLKKRTEYLLIKNN